MSTRPVFRAKVNVTGHGTVSIDDKDLSSLVSAFTIEADVGEVTRVRLDLIGPELDLEIEGVDVGVGFGQPEGQS